LSGELELMGTAEIAAMLGISRQRVLKLAEKPDFPRPLAVLSMGKVWLGSDIRTWAGPRAAKRGAPD
jgi:prophage regulatory protein